MSAHGAHFEVMLSTSSTKINTKNIRKIFRLRKKYDRFLRECCLSACERLSKVERERDLFYARAARM